MNAGRPPLATRRSLLAAVVALAVGCAQPGRPPVAERSPVFGPRPESHLVRRGDTLYSIAWRYGLDYRALARANGLAAPYTIYVGQRIRLTEAPVAAAARPAPHPAPKPSKPRGSPTPGGSTGPWRLPTEGAVARGYGSGNKGIDFRLESGNGVRAAAAGEVVYAGSGLGGYRHLVIVKHPGDYLSAYSFHRAMAVSEGDRLSAGALLASARGSRAETLHFEIRKGGEPVDPMKMIRSG